MIAVLEAARAGLLRPGNWPRNIAAGAVVGGLLGNQQLGELAAYLREVVSVGGHTSFRLGAAGKAVDRVRVSNLR